MRSDSAPARLARITIAGCLCGLLLVLAYLPPRVSQSELDRTLVAAARAEYLSQVPSAWLRGLVFPHWSLVKKTEQEASLGQDPWILACIREHSLFGLSSPHESLWELHPDGAEWSAVSMFSDGSACINLAYEELCSP